MWPSQGLPDIERMPTTKPPLAEANGGGARFVIDLPQPPLPAPDHADA